MEFQTRKEAVAFAAASFLYPQGESNAYRRNRNPKFYPLNYGGILRNANILIFCIFADVNLTQI